MVFRLDLANKWLGRAAAKPDVRADGEQAAKLIIALAEQVPYTPHKLEHTYIPLTLSPKG
jgi:hypothetical protein